MRNIDERCQFGYFKMKKTQLEGTVSFFQKIVIDVIPIAWVLAEFNTNQFRFYSLSLSGAAGVASKYTKWRRSQGFFSLDLLISLREKCAKPSQVGSAISATYIAIWLTIN